MGYSRVAEMASISAKNTTTSILNALLGTNAARQPVAEAGDDQEQIYQALIDAGFAPIKLVGGMIGVIVGTGSALISKKKIELDSTEVYFTSPSGEHYTIISLENASIANVQSSKILKVTESAMELNKATGERTDSTSTRSSLPVALRPSGEMAEPSNDDEARSVERKTTTIGGAQIAAASASVAAQGLGELLSSTFTLASIAGRRAYGLYQQNSGSAQPAESPPSGSNHEPSAANDAASTRPSTS